MVRLRPVWMTNHPPSVLWHCWLGHQTCKNRLPYNLYCVGADVKPSSINQSISVYCLGMWTLQLDRQCYHPLLLAMASVPNRDSEFLSGPGDAETELGSFFIHWNESGREAFLLVDEQSDVVSITNVREGVLANLDADCNKWWKSVIGFLIDVCLTDDT